MDLGTDICTLMDMKCMVHSDLLYSTGKSTQYSVITYAGKKNLKRMDMCVCITELYCCIAEILTIL